MRLCDYVIAEDNRVDLHNLERAWAWLSSRQWWPKQQPTPDSKESGDPAGWTDTAQLEWQKNIYALRSLWRRRTGKRPKRRYRATEDFDADRVLENYLLLMRLVIPARWHGGPLTRDSFVGLLPYPTLSQWGGTRRPIVPDAMSFCELDVFWQCVFYSLTVGDRPGPFQAPHLCEDCGKMMPPTPKGRQSKRRLCNRCQHRRQVMKETPEERRARWRREKRQQRRSLTTGLAPPVTNQ